MYIEYKTQGNSIQDYIVNMITYKMLYVKYMYIRYKNRIHFSISNNSHG